MSPLEDEHPEEHQFDVKDVAIPSRRAFREEGIDQTGPQPPAPSKSNPVGKPYEVAAGGMIVGCQVKAVAASPHPGDFRFDNLDIVCTVGYQYVRLRDKPDYHLRYSPKTGWQLWWEDREPVMAIDAFPRMWLLASEYGNPKLQLEIITEFGNVRVLG